MVALNLFPDNPIKQQYSEEINEYVAPYFNQTWNLFSPDPVNTNTRIIFRYEFFNKGKVFEDKWIDVVGPLIKAKENSFWAPAQRILKNFTTTTSQIFKEMDEVRKKAEATDSLKNNPSEILQMKNQSLKKSNSHKILLQYANYILINDFRGKMNKADSVVIRYRIVLEKFPRFSKRDLDYFDKKNYSFSKFESPAVRIR